MKFESPPAGLVGGGGGGSLLGAWPTDLLLLLPNQPQVEVYMVWFGLVFFFAWTRPLLCLGNSFCYTPMHGQTKIFFFVIQEVNGLNLLTPLGGIVGLSCPLPNLPSPAPCHVPCPAPCSLFPAPCSLLPAPYTALPCPASTPWTCTSFH